MKKESLGMPWDVIFGSQSATDNMNKKTPIIHFSPTKYRALKYKKKILTSIAAVIDKGIFLNGENVVRLEKKLSRMFDRNVIAVASGHDALSVSLQALNLKKEDEIIFPANAYPTAFPVFLSGSKPVAVDVDENGQLDPVAVEKNITRHTKVIITVHLYGLVGSLDKIVALAKRNNLILIEDCAQAFGTKFRGNYVGTFGDIGCLSFYPTKNLGTLGDGGAVVTKSENYLTYIKKARQYGEKERYNSRFVSGHSRLPEIQAAILNVYLDDFESIKKMKDKIFDYYKRELTHANFYEKVRILNTDDQADPVRHLLVVETKKRSRLRNYLHSFGIETMIHYPYPISKIFAFKNLKTESIPMSERLSRGILSLPFHEYLTYKEVQYIVTKVKDFYAKT